MHLQQKPPKPAAATRLQKTQDTRHMSAAHRQNSAHALPLAPQNRFALGGMRGNGLLFLLHLRLTSLLTRALQDDLLGLLGKQKGLGQRKMRRENLYWS
jgi:hypothetical protein